LVKSFTSINHYNTALKKIQTSTKISFKKVCLLGKLLIYLTSFERSERGKKRGTRCPEAFYYEPFPEGKSGKKQGTRCPEAFYYSAIILHIPQFIAYSNLSVS